jgi:hypothetical protein
MIKADPLTAKAGFGVVDQSLEARRVKGGGTARGRAEVPVGNKDYLFGPGRGEAAGIVFRIGKGHGNIREGVQGVHQQHAADDGFKLPLTGYAAGNLQPGLIGKGNKVKGIADAQEFRKKRTGHVIPYFPIGHAHA